MWYKNNFRRNLIDMHISDWNPEFMSKFDPEVYADAVATAGMDTAIISAGSCLGICYWPSKLGHMHEGIKGRDIFGETVTACRKRGLRVVGYYNTCNRYEFDRHPEWRFKDAEGKEAGPDYGLRYAFCCPNTGYRDFMLQQVEDLTSSYKLDGLWIDMIGFHGIVCQCDGCKKAFKEQTGLDIPTDVDFDNPHWVSFIRKRQEWTTKFAKDIAETAKKQQPNISVSFQSSTFLAGWTGAATEEFYAQSDYLAGDFYLEAWEEAFICKLMRALSVKKSPIEFMVSSCVDLNEHTTLKPVEMITLQMLMAVSHMGAFVPIDAIDPSGSVHKHLYERLNPVIEKMEPYIGNLGKSWKQLADVAIYFNIDNITDENGCNESTCARPFPKLATAYNMAKSLVEANIAFDVITSRQLNSLQDYKAVIISDTYMIDKREELAFTSYVKEGGNIYVSGKCGFVDGDGNRRGDFAMADVLGVHYKGDFKWPIAYICPKKEAKDLLEYYRPEYPMCVLGNQPMVTTDEDTEVLAVRAESINRPTDLNHYATALSNPPLVFTEEPSLTIHKYGKGKAMYITGPVESGKQDVQRKVFGNLVNELITDPIVKSNAPAPVQINLFKSEEENVMLVNLLNFQQQLPVIPIHNLWVWIDTKGKRVASAVVVDQHTPCRYQEKDGGVLCHIDKLTEFAMIQLELN